MTRVVRGLVYVDSKMSYPKDYGPSPMIKEWKHAHEEAFTCVHLPYKRITWFLYTQAN